jgi:hypothetical protein
VFNKLVLKEVLLSGLYIGGVAFAFCCVLDLSFDLSLAEKRIWTLLLGEAFNWPKRRTDDRREPGGP